MAFRQVRSIVRSVSLQYDSVVKTIDWREDVLDAINGVYLPVSAEMDWLNLETEADWRVWADRTGTSTGFTVAVTNGSYLVTFSGSLTAAFIADNEGQVFEDDGGLRYRINRFASTTTAYLDAPYAGTTRAALATWTIECRRFMLPTDCARPLGFIDRINGNGRMVVLNRRTDERWFSQQNTSTGTVYWLVDDDTSYDRPPDSDTLFAVADNTGAAATTLAASSVYDYCYTLVKQGRESPPSVPIRLTTGTGAQHRGDVSGMEDTRDGALLTGIYKKLYARQMRRGSADVYGRWLLIATLAEATTTYTHDATGDRDAPLTFQNGRKWMKTRWIPSADATLRLRYLRAPPRLVSDADVPNWPEAYHDLLVWGAAIAMAPEHGQTGKVPVWQAEYDRIYRNMRASLINVPDTPSQRQGWGRGGGKNPYRAGVASTDFSD